jgi:hypothetical protein
LGAKSCGENEWGDGDKSGEEGMWTEEGDWGKVMWDERQERNEQGDWLL